MIDYNKVYLSICFGTEHEFKQLQNLHHTAMKEAVETSIGVWDAHAQYARLRKNFDKSFKSLNFIVHEKSVIGSINVRDEFFEDLQRSVAYVEHFYIYPQYQGFGIGTWLMNNHVPKQCRLSHLKNDEKAAKFYLKNGFQIYQQDEYQSYVERF